MIRIQCTSCKKTLEVDETTLSDREASVVRCPSCSVTLLVDKRKKSATGPDVRIATEDYGPLLPSPSADELQKIAPSSTHIALIADLYAAAEQHLRVKNGISDRVATLNAVASTAQEALCGMRVKVPSPSSEEMVRAVKTAPANRVVDEQLTTLDAYLQASRKISDLASTIWRNVTARHRYAPIVTWQTEARAAVAAAYGAVAARTRDPESHIERLQNTQSKFEELVKQYHSEESSYVAKTSAARKKVKTAETEYAAAQARLSELEKVAGKYATEALPGGGCASVVAAAIIGAIAGGSTNSAGAGWMVFFLALAAGFWLAWQIGFARNRSERENVEYQLSEIHERQITAERELGEIEKTLDLHKASTPSIASATTTWSILTSPDFDPETAPRVVESVGDRLHTKREHDPAQPMPIPEVPAAQLNATVATRVQSAGVAAGRVAARTVGFIPSQVSAASAMTADMVVPAPIPAADEWSTPAAVVAQAAPKPRRLAAIIAVSSLVILVASYFIWSSTFSFSARIQKALSAGQIFEPAGTSVYDLYKREHASNPRSPVLQKIAPRIRGALAPVADEAFTRWYRDSDNTHRWEELERTCEFLVLLEPDTKLHRKRRLYAIAQRSIDSLDYARALSSYEDALRLDPSWVLALNGIGKVYMIESSPLFNERLGLAYYERAVAADPQFTWAAKNLGDYAIRKRDYAMAERYLRQALASSPQRSSILRALGLVCRKTGRRAEAINYYEQSLAMEKDPEKIDAAMKAIAGIRNGAG